MLPWTHHRRFGEITFSRRLLHYITGAFLCQYVLQNFLKTFDSESFRIIASCGDGLYYIIAKSVCQYFFRTFSRKNSGFEKNFLTFGAITGTASTKKGDHTRDPVVACAFPTADPVSAPLCIRQQKVSDIRRGTRFPHHIDEVPDSPMLSVEYRFLRIPAKCRFPHMSGEVPNFLIMSAEYRVCPSRRDYRSSVQRRHNGISALCRPLCGLFTVQHLMFTAHYSLFATVVHGLWFTACC